MGKIQLSVNPCKLQEVIDSCDVSSGRVTQYQTQITQDREVTTESAQER